MTEFQTHFEIGKHYPNDEETPTGVDDNFGDSKKKTPTKTYEVVSPDKMLITGTATGTGVKDYGAKKTHISAEFGLGAVTLGLGHSQKESNKPGTTDKTKINYLGLQDSIGDTGLNWLGWVRSIEKLME